MGMKIRVSNLDKNETNKKEWFLTYIIVLHKAEDVDDIISRHVNFRADSHEEVLRKALKILKASAKKISHGKDYRAVMVMPGQWHPFAVVQTEELFRLKRKYANRKEILRMREKDLQKYFVQGYGYEAAKQLNEK